MFKDFSNFNDSVKTMRLTGYDSQISSLISGLKSIQSAGSSMVDAYARNYVMVQTLGSNADGAVVDQTDAARQSAADAALTSLKRSVQSVVDGATSLKRYLNSIPLPKTAATETLYGVEASKEFLPGWINSVPITPDFKCQANLNGGDALMVRKSWLFRFEGSANDVAVGSGVMYRHSELPWAIYQMHADLNSGSRKFMSTFVVISRVDGAWKAQMGFLVSAKRQLAESYFTFDHDGWVTGCTGGTELEAYLTRTPKAIDDIVKVIPIQASLQTQAIYALATFISVMPDILLNAALGTNLDGAISTFNSFIGSGMTIKPILVKAGECGIMAIQNSVQPTTFPTITTNGESILSSEITPVANNISSLGDALVAAVVTKDINSMNEILQNA